MAVAMTIAVMRLRCTLEERTRLNLSAPAGTPAGDAFSSKADWDSSRTPAGHNSTPRRRLRRQRRNTRVGARGD
jgi:hypothetical protein